MMRCLAGKDALNAVVKWSAKLMEPNSGSGLGGWHSENNCRVIPHDAPPRIIAYM